MSGVIHTSNLSKIKKSLKTNLRMEGRLNKTAHFITTTSDVLVRDNTVKRRVISKDQLFENIVER